MTSKKIFIQRRKEQTPHECPSLLRGDRSVKQEKRVEKRENKLPHVTDTRDVCLTVSSLRLTHTEREEERAREFYLTPQAIKIKQDKDDAGHIKAVRTHFGFD